MTPALEVSPGTAPSAQDFALAYIQSVSLDHKTDPGPPPSHFSADLPPLDPGPGRPPEIVVTLDKPRSFKLGALAHPEARAGLQHKFWHHELQAAELMCWAIVRFPDTPIEFRRGLLRIFRDEVRHMKLYQVHIETLGYKVGDFPVRDWFWERVTTCQSALEFVALLGMGLEGANLDHTARFAIWLRTMGDHRGAEIQELVGKEEVMHVKFAVHWFRTWTGGVEFDRWKECLPFPLSPMLMRGKTVQQAAREKAEFPREFIDNLAAFSPDPRAG